MVAKMVITGVSDCINEDQEKYAEDVYFTAVYSDDPKSENYSFAKATPNANAFFHIENPALFGTHKRGQEFKLTFELCL